MNSTSIDPTHALGLLSTAASVTSMVATATDAGSLYQYSQMLRGASASLEIISAQQVLATATASAAQASAEAVISSAMEDLAGLAWQQNNYSEWLTMWPNALFAAIFGILFVGHLTLTILSNYWYYGCMFFIGAGLEFAGYLSRCLSVGHESEVNPFLCQIIVLTIAPAFIMAGVYYVLGKLLVFHGQHFLTLQPRWFSYIFVTCDVISLVVQAVGGGMAATALLNGNSAQAGTHVMVGGIAFQVLSMSLFLIVYAQFMFRIYFRCSPDVRFSCRTFFSLLLDTKSSQPTRTLLEPHYEMGYAHLRAHARFTLLPLSLLLSTVLVYIRCIYRLVELSQGWTGYVISHEAFLAALDALPVTGTCLLAAAFHPWFSWGSHHAQKVAEAEVRAIENGETEAKTGAASAYSAGLSDIH